MRQRRVAPSPISAGRRSKSMRRTAYLGQHGRSLQLSVDALSVEILNDAVARLSDLVGIPVTASSVIRFAIIEELGELVRVLDDLGEPDRRELRDKLIQARTCRPAVKETTCSAPSSS